MLQIIRQCGQAGNSGGPAVTVNPNAPQYISLPGSGFPGLTDREKDN